MTDAFFFPLQLLYPLFLILSIIVFSDLLLFLIESIIVFSDLTTLETNTFNISTIPVFQPYPFFDNNIFDTPNHFW